MKFNEIEFDETEIVVQSLKELRDGFISDLNQINTTGKPVGYVSWDSPEEDRREINKEIDALVRVLKLYGE
jgi:hypothetical protein